VDNAVDVESFSWAAPAEAPAVLLFVGTLSIRKGLVDLLQAAAQVRAPAGSWQLVVVGGAAEVGEPEADQIRQVARDLGLAGALAGPRRGEDLRRTFASSSALVLPSHWEGQPMVILEAMASGLPIISTRVGAIADVVRHDVEGLLLEPHDVPGLTAALERAISSPDDRARWGTAARDRVLERHDMPVLAGRLGALYREVTPRNRGGISPVKS
jgi:glycosyltransferase involved in cell wall biosynthesis